MILYHYNIETLLTLYILFPSLPPYPPLFIVYIHIPIPMISINTINIYINMISYVYY